MSFAEKLRVLRNQHGLTQGELASQLGLNNHSHIAHLERPRQADSQKADAPSLELAYAITRLFDVSTDYMLRDSIPAEPPPPSRLVPVPPEGIHITALGTKIRHLRQQHGWSLTILGQHVRLSSEAPAYTRYYLSNIEAGRRLPSLPLLIRLADVFGTTTDFLLRDDIAVDSAGKYYEESH